MRVPISSRSFGPLSKFYTATHGTTRRERDAGLTSPACCADRGRSNSGPSLKTRSTRYCARANRSPFKARASTNTAFVSSLDNGMVASFLRLVRHIDHANVDPKTWSPRKRLVRWPFTRGPTAACATKPSSLRTTKSSAALPKPLASALPANRHRRQPPFPKKTVDALLLPAVQKLRRHSCRLVRGRVTKRTAFLVHVRSPDFRFSGVAAVTSVAAALLPPPLASFSRHGEISLEGRGTVSPESSYKRSVGFMRRDTPWSYPPRPTLIASS